MIEHARDIFYNKATISSIPTIKGVKEIDSCHPLYGYHRLVRKSLSTFSSDEFFYLEEGKQQDLLNYSINVNEGVELLQNQFIQLLTDKESRYYQLQEESIKICISVLKRNTEDMLMTVGLCEY